MDDSIDACRTFSAAISGDENALGSLLDLFRNQLRESTRKHLQGNLARRIDESDVIQQTYSRAIQHFQQFHGHTLEEFWSWLQQISHSVLVDLVRHHQAQKRNGQQEEVSHNIDELSAHITSPSQHAMHGERQERLELAISNLPELQRDAIQLRYIKGLKVVEIARLMRRSEEAVAGLLKRGIATLKENMKNGNY